MSKVKFCCESCGEQKNVIIDPLKTDELNKPAIWSDIRCAECNFVIATISADEPGIYDIVKVRGK